MLTLIIRFSDYSMAYHMSCDDCDLTIQYLNQYASPSWSWRLI